MNGAEVIGGALERERREVRHRRRGEGFVCPVTPGSSQALPNCPLDLSGASLDFEFAIDLLDLVF